MSRDERQLNHESTECNEIEEFNINKTFADIYKEVAGVDISPDTNFVATWSHMMGSCAGSYYRYMWSQVFAADMWSEKFEGNPLNPEVGRLYREAIINNGSTKSANVLLKDFLGREPNSKAFGEAVFKIEQEVKLEED